METIESFERKIRLDLRYDYYDALKRLGYATKDIDKVRELVKNDEVVPKFLLNSLILIFLNFCDGDHQKTADRLHVYYKFRKEVPEFFLNRDTLSTEVAQCLNNQFIASFPITSDGCNLIGGGLVNDDPKNYIFDNATRTLIMISEAYFFVNGPHKELIFVVSLKDTHFWHVLRPSISSIRKALHFLENAAPVNVKAVYVFNTSPIVKYMIALAKPFASSELLSKAQFFTSDIDWNEFHKNHLPKSHLPAEFNGDLPTLNELNEDGKKLLRDLREYFIIEEESINGKYDHLAEEAKNRNW